MKTNIVNDCDCPIGTQQMNTTQDIRIYNNPLYQPYPDAIVDISNWQVLEYVSCAGDNVVY